MKDNKIQTGLRIPQSRYEELLEMAERSGTSINSIVLMLIDIGIMTVNLGKEQAAHSASHILQHSDEQ